MERRHPRLFPGPPTKTQRIVTPDTEAMTLDLPVTVSTGRDFPNNALSDMAKVLQKKLAKKNRKDDGTDTSFDSILSDIHVTITGTKDRIDGCPESFLDSLDQFIANVNVAKKSDPGFVDSLRQAVNGNNGELWGPILTHDVFYTVISDDSGHMSDFAKSQEEAVMRSWWTPFAGEHVLEALTDHIAEERRKKGSYVPFCSIVQSSGMGKSRLVDEFSKTNFLIPINLREAGARGFPPPDDAVRDLLTQPDPVGGNKTFVRSLHFLVALFQRAARVITNDLKGASSRAERIRRFREFMTDGQTMSSEIVDDVEIEMNQNGESTVTTGDVGRALQTLLSCLDDDNDAQIGRKRKKANANDILPGVFIAFDEAHSLAQPIEPTVESNDNNRTFFIELRSALQALLDTSSFVFFLTTTSKISQFAMPGEIDPSARMHDKILRSPLPFSDLGFDHLMRDRKIFDAFKTISDVTSTDCVAHMGRPLWGAIYDSGLNRETLLDFVIIKLLCGRDDRSGDLSLSTDQQCAVLSQRLALDIDSSAYITSGSTRNYVMADKVQLQIANYMRVCIGIPRDLVAVRGVAASEPILSEAASCIMRGDYNFDLCDALFNVLDSYAINHGDRGELLVAAFFTRARDLYVGRIPPDELFPNVLTQICPIFSVKDLFSELFQEAHFNTMLGSLPSIRRPGFPLDKFGDVFGRTKMHFNHMIKPLKQDVLTRSRLLAMMARGAAAFGANGQFGFDLVYPFLYGTSDLDVKQIGFIIIQVKNYANRLAPDPMLFKKMDPFLCDLLSKKDTDFAVPIIRIVFALGGGVPSFTQQTYESPDDGAVTFDGHRRPRFTSYDFWCSGIGPNLLRPVDEDDAPKKWETLLDKTDKWDHVFSTSDVRRSQYPAGGSNVDHYLNWTFHNWNNLLKYAFYTVIKIIVKVSLSI
ncbi:hypothetical protein EDB85DRAFT_2287937 [Lactarius pseudohatsudake]|nr:hypothetical protein EDB85DRAFT_2287937 [Lactarius pseudohatsudake]